MGARPWVEHPSNTPRVVKGGGELVEDGKRWIGVKMALGELCLVVRIVQGRWGRGGPSKSGSQRRWRGRGRIWSGESDRGQEWVIWAGMLVLIVLLLEGVHRGI